jgi:hypothetical protein
MFSRCLAMTTLSIVAIGGVRYFPGSIEMPKQARMSLQQPSPMGGDQERYAQLADLHSRRDVYATVAALLENGLVRGTIDLGEATDRLFYFCVQNYPEHLEFVLMVETGQNIKTRLARNLMGTCQLALEDGRGGSCVDEIIARLNRELRDLTYEDEESGRLEQP